ncbi:hypothetical protein EDF56_106169 [Novosphingobium sp. PhB165]|uniref:hypothetical protein n=1 Tax=Novosphingobium sp. PhB165 TaxID=2485105 RepID=UPI00105044C0|nr:hypothetical protein [Novosphingobium sp. PhB165]TCM17057.1 hypothetical protein EDF56_106169 [Novosphingobium sp. PhB165]
MSRFPSPARYVSAERLAALHAGVRWWPVEIAMRAAGLLSLFVAERVILAERRMAITPVLHAPTVTDLALCAVFIVLLSLGLTLSLWGPRLFRTIELPGHF